MTYAMRNEKYYDNFHLKYYGSAMRNSMRNAMRNTMRNTKRNTMKISLIRFCCYQGFTFTAKLGREAT